MYPSSTFSFDGPGTLFLAEGRNRDWWRPPLLAVLLVLAAELVIRTCVLEDPRLGEFWHPDAGRKILGYIDRAQAGEVPDILVVGDSTAETGVDPMALQAGLREQVATFNLAMSANYPFAFAGTTTPLLDGRYAVPRLVIYESWVGALYRAGPQGAEAQIVASPYVQRRLGLRRLPEFWDLRLTRARMILSPRENHGQATQRNGFAPLHKVADPARELPVAVPVAATARVSPARLQVLDDLARVLHTQGSTLVLVIPPQMNHEVERSWGRAVAALHQVAAAHGGYVVDLRASPGLEFSHFNDQGHLNAAGAAYCSRLLGGALRPIWAQLPPRYPRAAAARHPASQTARAAH